MLICSACMASNAQNTSGNCYRGFVDAGYDVGIGDYEFGRFVINTTHGYQFNPYIFLGAGTGFHFMSEYKTKDLDIALDTRESKVDIPVFANAHVNFTKRKVAPFVDGKAGTFVTNNGGMFWNISAGCRIATNEKQAVNISIGYAAEKLEFESFDRFNSSHDMSYTRKARVLNAECVTLRVGYEF
ncbi:outer membrane beta-barrel protein [Bacteroides ovatus]|nr:outer membrane beta-barrel protein [Bacteroides ovatus]